VEDPRRTVRTVRSDPWRARHALPLHLPVNTTRGRVEGRDLSASPHSRRIPFLWGAVWELLDLVLGRRGDLCFCVAPVGQNPSNMTDRRIA